MSRKTETPNPYYSGPRSDHFNGTRFFNPGGVPPGKGSDLLKWRLREKRVAWPKHHPSPHHPHRPEPRVDGDRLRVTMVGHATLLIQTQGLNILTDPVWSARVSPFSFLGPKRVNPPGIPFSDLPGIDLVLVSHNHYDHLDLKTLAMIERHHGAHIVTPLGNDRIIRKAAPKGRIDTLDWGDRLELGQGVSIHGEPSHHWSARWTNDRRMALWAAFVIETPAGKIYHVGDTGFHSGINYRAAAEKHERFRLAILPIGAYEPRWFMQGQHQNPDEAVEGMQLCRADHAVGHHWGTFRLTDEAIEAPREALELALDRAGIERHRFRALRPGEAMDVPLQATDTATGN